MSTGLNFNAATFGKQPAAASAPADRPKAQFWLNIGYTVTVQGEDGPEDRFISLPAGIPLDNIEHLKTNTSNAVFNQFQAARNNLLDTVLEKAQSLQPGEEFIVTQGENGLAVQLRRIKEESAPVDPSENMFLGAFKL